MSHSMIPLAGSATGSTRRRQRGVTAIEYALLGALIAVVIVGAVATTGTSLLTLFTDVADRVACAAANDC